MTPPEGAWRHDLPPSPCDVCGGPATTADPDGRVAHIPCAITPESIVARRLATPSTQVRACKILRRQLGLDVVASHFDGELWSVETRDGRRVVLGSRRRLKDPDHVARVLRDAGVERARLLRRPENAGGLLGFLVQARAE